VSRTILDDLRKTARNLPDHPAFVPQNGDPLSYGTLIERVKEEAAALRRASIRPGERCGLMGEQNVDYAVRALAVLEAGMCLAPLPRNRWARRLPGAARRLGLHHHITDEDGFRTVHREDALSLPEKEYGARRPAYLRMTSGTTGKRKGVLLGHDALRSRTEAVNRSLDVGPRDRVLWVLSMANHFVSSILLYLRYGATVLLVEDHLAKPLLGFARREEATLLYATPYHYDRLAGEPSERDLPSVRRAVSTATGLRRDVADRFRRRYGHPLTQALGIIECGLPVMNLERAAEKPDSVGQIQPAYEVVLRDAGGAVWGPGEHPGRTGEICVGGPGFFDAYLHPWTPAREVLEEGRFPTGDEGRFDEEGDLYLVGRRVNRINVAGLKFFCEEVEAVIDRHPRVGASRVYGEQHPRLGEIPRAQIVPADADPPDGDELKSWLREHLPAHQIPRSFEVVDALPRTPTGKIKRGDVSGDDSD